MRRFVRSVWRCTVASFLLAGCHRGVPDELPTFETKTGFADKFYDVQALDADRAVIVGYAGKIILTEDGGRTWKLLDSGTDKALYSVEFVNADRGWVSGQDGVLLTTHDGGKTWTRQKTGVLLYLFALDFIDDREGWVVGDRATYLHTLDGGQTWRLNKFATSEALTAEEALVSQDPILYDVQFVDRKTGWVVGEFGKIYHTADGGKTWVEQQDSLLGTEGIFEALDIPTFFGVHFIDPLNGIVAGLQGRIARTRDGGRTWKFEEFQLDVPMADPLFQPFQFPDTTAWAVGAAGEVAYQPQPGAAWQRAPMGMEVLTWMRGIDFYDKKHGWLVGGRGHILRTTDGGQTWLPIVG